MPKMGIDCSRGRIRVQSRNGVDYWPHVDATEEDLADAGYVSQALLTGERDALRARLTELEQRLARVAQLAHDRNDDSHEWRSRRLGQCASIAWDHMEESFSKDPLKRRSTLKWAHLAQQLADVERERDDLKARLAGV